MYFEALNYIMPVQAQIKIIADSVNVIFRKETFNEHVILHFRKLLLVFFFSFFFFFVFIFLGKA